MHSPELGDFFFQGLAMKIPFWYYLQKESRSSCIVVANAMGGKRPLQTYSLWESHVNQVGWEDSQESVALCVCHPCL